MLPGHFRREFSLPRSSGDVEHELANGHELMHSCKPYTGKSAGASMTRTLGIDGMLLGDRFPRRSQSWCEFRLESHPRCQLAALQDEASHLLRVTPACSFKEFRKVVEKCHLVVVGGVLAVQISPSCVLEYNLLTLTTGDCLAASNFRTSMNGMRVEATIVPFDVTPTSYAARTLFRM